eukprot:31350-Pelagococcus_subviridis.AAC.5
MIRVCQFMYGFPLDVSTAWTHRGGGGGGGDASSTSAYRTPSRCGTTPLVHRTLAPSAAGRAFTSASRFSQHSLLSGCHTHVVHVPASKHDAQHPAASSLRFSFPFFTTSPHRSVFALASPQTVSVDGALASGGSGRSESGNSSGGSSSSAEVDASDDDDDDDDEDEDVVVVEVEPFNSLAPSAVRRPPRARSRAGRSNVSRRRGRRGALASTRVSPASRARASGSAATTRRDARSTRSSWSSTPDDAGLDSRAQSARAANPNPKPWIARRRARCFDARVAIVTGRREPGASDDGSRCNRLGRDETCAK